MKVVAAISVESFFFIFVLITMVIRRMKHLTQKYILVICYIYESMKDGATFCCKIFYYLSQVRWLEE